MGRPGGGSEAAWLDHGGDHLRRGAGTGEDDVAGQSVASSSQSLGQLHLLFFFVLLLSRPLVVCSKCTRGGRDMSSFLMVRVRVRVRVRVSCEGERAACVIAITAKGGEERRGQC